MKSFRFPSLHTLILASFSLVLLPLLLALGSALYALEKLTSYGQNVVYRSVRITHSSRVLLEHLVAMERSARQSLILADPGLFQYYQDVRKTFVAELQGLQKIVAEADLTRLLALLLGFFFVSIIRPIRQLDAAIRKLGDKDFNQPIKVQGPRDLEALGKRLEWLRTRLSMLEAGKQRFMRNISHELKTPLANIHEGVELLADQVVGELTLEQAEIIRIILDNADKLYRMIEDLIRYSQLQRVDEAMHPQMVDMKLLVEETIEDYRVRLCANELRLQSQLAPLKFYGFPELLRSMVDNLLSNAVKYSPRGGEITVALFHKEGNMYFEIKDQGPGILPEERKRVFDVLYQGVIGRKLGIEGTGLGLAIVNECVVMHHGRVDILDPPHGQGAYFQVVIPLEGVQVE